MDWKKTLLSIAPSLGTALGSPLAGTAIKLLSNVLLGKDDGKEDEVSKAIESGLTPDQIATIKKVDNDFNIQMKQLDVRLDELAFADTANARDREIKTNDHWTPRILAAIVLTGFYYAVHWALTNDRTMDPNQSLLVGGVIGYASAKADQVIGYFFGSTAANKVKDNTIAKAMNK